MPLLYEVHENHFSHRSHGPHDGSLCIALKTLK